MSDLMVFGAEVREALERHRPVVALESSVIAQGLPYPENLEIASRLQAIVRERGAVPATIGLVAGTIRVGLEEHEIERLGTEASVEKVSRRDLAAALAKGGLGATTVAATMLIAKQAGIDVMATGGIGGVSRGGASTLDISADLTELGRTNIVVVCAGTKSLMDVRLTLEVLETQGVPVLGFQTHELPGFYIRTTGYRLERCVATPEEVAEIAHCQRKLGLPAAILVVAPIPEAFALEPEEVERAIELALADAESAGQTGKDLTPFVLSALHRLTEGRSVRANTALLGHNAAVASDIATAMARL